MLTRGDVVAGVRCPECHEAPGRRCRGARGRERVQAHGARWAAFTAAGDVEPLRAPLRLAIGEPRT